MLLTFYDVSCETYDVITPSSHPRWCIQLFSHNCAMMLCWHQPPVLASTLTNWRSIDIISISNMEQQRPRANYKKILEEIKCIQDQARDRAQSSTSLRIMPLASDASSTTACIQDRTNSSTASSIVPSAAAASPTTASPSAASFPTTCPSVFFNTNQRQWRMPFGFPVLSGLYPPVSY